MLSASGPLSNYKVSSFKLDPCPETSQISESSSLEGKTQKAFTAFNSGQTILPSFLSMHRENKLLQNIPEFKPELERLGENIFNHIQNISLYRSFESNCGLPGISHARGLDSFHHLILSLEEMTRIFEEHYLDQKEKIRNDLLFAKIEWLEGLLERISLALTEHHQTLVDLVENVLDKPTDKAEIEQLKKVKDFINKERPVIEQTLKRISFFNLPRHARDTDSLQEKPASPNAWITSLFQAMRHPIKTLQNVFDTIEKMSPLPSYSAQVLISKKAASIERSLDFLHNFLEAHLSSLDNSLEAITRHLEDMPVVPNEIEIKDSLTMKYQRWLGKFSLVLQAGQASIALLEAQKFPTEADIDQANKALRAMEAKKEALNAMEMGLIKQGFSNAVINRLYAVIDKSCVEIGDLIELLHSRIEVNALSEKCNDLVISSSDLALELSKGSKNFSVEEEAALLKSLQAFKRLYENTYQSDLPDSYKNEIFKKIAEEVSFIAFARSEYRTDYQQALEAEVASVILLPRDSDEAKSKTKALLNHLCAAEELYFQHNSNAFELEDSLAKLEKDAGDEPVLKAYKQLKGDLKFIRKQRDILEHKQEITTFKASWIIRSHTKSVERTVKILDEGLNKKEETWSDTLMRFWLYSLYHHERISSTVQFFSQIVKSWDTGKSPLKSYADILSDAEFAKNVEKLPAEEQAKTAVELALIEGILNGYIEYPADLKKNHPATALFLLKKFNISPPNDPMLESEKGSFERKEVQGGPDRRDLSDTERNQMVIQYIGARVRGHYRKTQQQLEGPYMKTAEVDWTMHFHHTPDTEQIPTKETSQNPLEQFGQQLVDAIKDNQRGIPSDQNRHLKDLQKDLQAAFGTPLPNEWIEQRLFKQEWSEERLTHFSGWLSESIRAQASYFLAQQRASQENSSGTLMTTPPLLTASIGQQEVGSSIHSVVQLLPSEKQEYFYHPLETSSASTSTNPLAPLFKIIQAIRSGVVNAIWSTDRVGSEKMKTSLDPIHKEILSQLEGNRSLLQLKTLINSPTRPIDDKLFQHILGSYFGKKTGLEGYDPAAILDYLVELTHSKIRALNENPLCNENSQLDFCRTLLERGEEELPIQLFSAMATQMEQAQKLGTAFKGDLAKFYRVFESKVHSLKPGASFFFSGGWDERYGGGHHVVYEVLKQPENLLTFRIYNRGAGTEFHANALVQGKELLLPFTEIVDIEPGRMISIPFIKCLKDLKTRDKNQWDAKEAKYLYEGILPILGGSNSQRVYSADYLMEQQLAGHCSYLSFTPWMRQQLGDHPTYSRWQFEVELKTLVDYFKQQQYHLPFSEQARHLIREGLSQFGRNVDNAYRNGLITDDEMPWIQKLIKGISLASEYAETIYQEIVNAKAERVAIKPIMDKLSVKVDTIDGWENIDTHKPSPPPPYFAVDPQSWQYSPQNFNQDLHLFLDGIREARREGHDLNIKEGIQTFVEKVPLTGHVFWKEMTAEQGMEALSLLTALNDHYSFSLSIITDDNFTRNVLDLEHYLVVAKILTLSDAIMRHFKEEFGFEIPFLPENEMLDILDGRSAFTDVIHVEWADQLRQMNQYWHKIALIEPRKPDQLSFFGFEEMHSSVGDGNNRRGVWENPRDSILFKKKRKVWGANFFWHDIEFAKNWLKKPEVADRFAAEFPQYKDAAPIFKAMIAMADRGSIKSSPEKDSSSELFYNHPKTLLPAQFYHLRDIASSAAFLLHGPYIYFKNSVKNRDVEPEISLEVSRSFVKVEGEYKPCWFLDYTRFGLYNHLFKFDSLTSSRREDPLRDYIDPSFKLIETQGLPGGELFPFILGGKDIRFARNENDRLNPVRRRISPHQRQIIRLVTWPYKRRFLDNEDLLVDANSNKVVSRLNWADTQQRLRLSSVDDLQVLEVLSNYFKEPHLLTNKEEQKLFNFLVNERGLFIEELLRSPDHAALRSQQLAKFIRDQCETYENLGDVGMLLYFLKLNGQFQSLVLYILQHYPGSFPADYKDPFMDSRLQLKAIMENKGNSDKDRSIAAFLMMKTFSPQEDLTTDEAVDLLHSGIRISQYPPLHEMNRRDRLEISADYNDPLWGVPQLVEAWDLLRKMRGPLERVLQGEGKNPILNGLLKKYHPNAPEMQWEVDGHFPRFIADDGFTTIDVIKGNFLLKKKSKEILLKDHIKSIRNTQGAGLGGAQVAQNRFEFKDSEGNDYRVLIKNDRYSIIQGRFKGNWYQLVDQCLLCKVPYKFIERQIALRDTDLWLSSKENELFCKDSETDQYLYRLEIEKDSEGTPYFTIVHRTTAQGEDTAEILVDIYSKSGPYTFLERIEEKGYIAVWEDKVTHEPTHIELPRYNMDFEIISIGQERRAYCKQLPGYFLAPLQHVNALGDVTSYLVLQKEQEKGTFKQIVWMPCGQMQSIQEKPLETKTVPQYNTPRFVVHDVDPLTGQLKPRNGEGRLLLAMVYLWERKYAEALAYLRGYGSELASFSKNEKEIIGWIQEIERLNHDNTPQAKAVLMYSHYLKIRNRLDFEKEGFDQKKDDEYLTALAKDYNEYLTLREQIGHTQLKPDEELLILKSLPDLSSLARYRWETLSPWEFINRFPEQAFHDADFSFKNAFRFDDDDKDISKDWVLERLKNSQYTDTYLETFLKFVVYRILPNFFSLPDDLSLPEVDSFSKRFLSTYEQLQSKNYRKILPTLMEEITGIYPPSDMPLDILKEQVLQMLWLIRINSKSSIIEKTAAAMLGMVLENPHKAFYAEEIFAEKTKISFPQRFSKFREAVIKWKPSFIHLRSQIAETIEQDSILAMNKKISGLQGDVTVPAEFKTSSCQEEIDIFPKPIVDHLDLYISTKKPSQAEKMQAKNTSEALQNLFDVNTGDPVADRSFAELKKQIKDFGDVLGGVKNCYEIKDLQSLQNLKVQLKEKNADLSLVLHHRVEAILALANRPFTDPLEEAKKQTKLIGGLEKSLRLPELLQLFRMRNREKFHSRNPALTVQEIDQLIKQIRDFMIIAVTRQQQIRVIDKIDEIEKGICGKISEQELDALVGEFVTLATAVRQYEIQEHPEYLNLEYQSQILIRGAQAINQERIASFKPRVGTNQKNGAAVEIIPGAGKTSVNSPLQALNDADGKHLALVVMPESLMPQMSKEAQERLGDAYEQVVEIMSFDRADVFDIPRLERIQHRLNRIIEDQKVLLMTDSSIQSLVLKFVEKIVTCVSSAHLKDINYRRHLREIASFRGIFDILRTSGIVTIDEIHLILDVLKAHHFTLGEPLPINKEVQTAATDFYLILATHPLIQQKIRFSFLAAKGGEPFDPKYYRKEVQPILVQAILDGEVGKNDGEIRAFFQNLNARQKELVKAYLNNHINKEASTFVDKLPSMKIKNILAVLKEEICILLPLTGKKLVDVHYGALPQNATVTRKDTLLAIPYHGSNNPVINAQFGTDLEIIHYTIQMYLEKGISAEIVQQEIERLKKHIRDELTRGTIKTLEASPSYASYKKLCGQSQPPSPFNLSDRDIVEITKAANRDVNIQIDLIRRYILPQLKTYSQQLHTNGQIYEALFMMVRGFSGTVWNSDAFPKIFYEIFLSDTMARTLNILWENSPQKVETIHFPERKEFISSKDKALAIVESIYAKREGFLGSFADAAGLFREISDNEDVARTILSYQKSPIEGVAYYNREEKLYVIVKGQNQGVPIDQCGLSKEQIVAYWDQKHTYGADIKLGGLMTATISVSQFTMLFDLIQAAWRLRQLDRGQRVDFIVSDEDEKIIRDTLKRITHQEIEENLTLQHLLLYTMYNQAMRQGDDNHRSLKQKMQILLISKIFEIVIDSSVSETDLVDIIDKTKALFISTTSANPYDQYGKQEEFDERDLVLKEELEQFMNSPPMKAFAEHPVLRKRFSIKQIEAELHSIVNAERLKLPSQLMKAARYETELSVQLEAEKKTETKTETETETETQQRIELYGDEGTYDHPFQDVIWEKEKLFKKELFTQGNIDKIRRKPLPYSLEAADYLDKEISPIVRFRDVIDYEKMTKEYADLIDPDLSATINLMPVYRPDAFSSLPVFRPFGRFHDQTSYVLIVEDKITGERRFILADQVDAKQFRKILDEEKLNPYTGHKDIRICLYHLGLGVDAQGSDPIDISVLEKDPQIIKLKAQAKFLAGYLSYAEDEKKAIHKWIKAKGAQRLYEFFYHIVLNNQPRQQEAFPGSELGNIFEQYGVKL